MSLLVWVMMGIALWHFTVWVPDHFLGGIVGAFLTATAGAVVFGFLVSGLSVPGREETDLTQALVAVPGALIALAASWFAGSRREREAHEAARVT
jgi:hypothetical protein